MTRNKLILKNNYSLSLEISYLILSKNSCEFLSKIDLNKVGPLKNAGLWIPLWNKKINSYSVVCYRKSPNSKNFEKQTIESFLLNVNPKTPIIHLNGDSLDNRIENLKIVDTNIKTNTYKLILNKYILVNLFSRDLHFSGSFKLSIEDKGLLDLNYLWTTYRKHNKTYIIANTPKGRVYLDHVINPKSATSRIKHLNNDPFDYRRENIKFIEYNVI